MKMAELVTAEAPTRMGAVSPRSPLIVACCSATKRQEPAVRASDLVRGGGLASGDWLSAVAVAAPRSRADQLYSGRAFNTLKSAAASLEVDLGIVSAGLGFLLGTTHVPSYSLTLAEGPDALRHCAPGLDPRDWWARMSHSPFAVDLAGEVQSRPVTILALTRPYAAMLAETLEALGDDLARVRLVGLGLERVLPATLARSILPYDQRAEAFLNGGTRGEFAARAAAFHLAEWAGCAWDLDREREHAAAICQAGAAPTRPVRRRVTDAEILAVIAGAATDSPWAALRRLRGDGIACGSGRIGRIIAMAGGTA